MRRRDTGEARLLHPYVAVAAVDPQLINVVLVAEGDRLAHRFVDAGGVGRARDGRTAHDQGDGSASAEDEA